MTSIFVTFFLRCCSSDYSLPGSVNTLEARTCPAGERPVRAEKINQKRASSVIDRQKPNKWLRLDSLRQRLVISLFFCQSPMRGACSDRHVTRPSAAGTTPKWDDWHPLRMMTR